MGNPFPAFYDGLRSAITAAWPTVAGSKHPIYRESQVRRVAWRKLVESNRLASPWVVISVSNATQSMGWGLPNLVYTPRVEVFYVTEAVPGEKDMAKFIEGELAALVDMLHPWTQGFQLGGRVDVDTSAQNPANAAFLEENLPLFAGSASFDVRFSEDALPIFFDTQYLSLCKLTPYTVTTVGSISSASVNPAGAWDLLPALDMVAYAPVASANDLASKDARIADYRESDKADFTLTLGSLDGDGRSNLLTDIWHLRPPALEFTLRAKNLDDTDGKLLTLTAMCQQLRNGVVYGKNMTILTMKPTWGVMPTWT